MKKRLLYICLLFFSLAAFAGDWSYQLGLGTGTPFMNPSVEWLSGSGKEKLSSTCFGWDASIDFRPVKESNGLSLLFSYGAGYLNSKMKASQDTSFPDFSGMLNSVRLGAGKRLVDDERFGFTLNGILGFVWSVQTGTSSYTEFKRKSTLVNFSCMLGAEAYATYKLDSKWSIFLSATGLLNLGGTTTLKNKFLFASRNVSSKVDGSPKFGTFAVFPRLGVCYTF